MRVVTMDRMVTYVEKTSKNLWGAIGLLPPSHVRIEYWTTSKHFSSATSSSPSTSSSRSNYDNSATPFRKRSLLNHQSKHAGSVPWLARTTTRTTPCDLELRDGFYRTVACALRS
jgi:hypothetical protein